jgi:hypothetical protein
MKIPAGSTDSGGYDCWSGTPLVHLAAPVVGPQNFAWRQGVIEQFTYLLYGDLYQEYFSFSTLLFELN